MLTLLICIAVAENVVKFVVNESKSEIPTSGSVGSELSLLCIKSSPVAEGFMIWAMEKCKGDEFADSAAFPTLAPGILSLARIVAKHHPFSRQNVVNLASLFLTHSSSEVSPQKMNDIKEQALRLLLIVSTQGLAVYVFHLTTKNVKMNIMDSNLIRYFVSGALDIIRPPVSLSFIHAFGQLLSTQMCIEALTSEFFEVQKRSALKQLILSFNSYLTEPDKFTGIEKASIGLISSLNEVYGVSSQRKILIKK